MKNRIISLILALVLAFSCLSLNIFAAEEENAQDATAKDVASSVTGEADKITVEELCKKYGLGQDNGGYDLSAAQIAEKITDTTSYLNTDFSSSMKGLGATTPTINTLSGDLPGDGQRVLLTTEDGNNYYKWTDDNTIDADEYFQSTFLKLTSSNYTSYKAKGYVGASYAITFDFMYHDDTAFGKNMFNALRSYTGANFEYILAYYNFKLQKSTDNSAELLVVGADGSNDTGFILEKNEWAQITFYHTPHGLDGIRETIEDNNTVHVFVNGKRLKTVKAVADTSDVTATVGEETVTINPAYDFTLQRFRIGLNAYGIAVDDVRYYRGDFLECLHEWEYSHKHDAANNELVLTARCANCEKTESKSVPSAIIAGDYDLSAEELAEKLAEESQTSIVNTDFGGSESSSNYLGSGMTYSDGGYKENGTVVINWKNIAPGKDSAGNQYVKWQRPVAYNPETGLPFTEAEAEAESLSDKAKALITFEEGTPYYTGSLTGEYLQISYLSSTAQSTFEANPNNPLFGSAFTVTTDLIHYGTTDFSPFQIASNTADKFESLSIYPIKIYANGTLKAYDNQSDTHKLYTVSGVTIPANTKVQLSLTVTPRGLDGIKGTDDDNTYHIFIDGKCVAQNLVFLNPTHESYNAWEHTYTPSGSETATTVTVDPRTDFALRFVRVGQLTSALSSDVMQIDNFRTYLGRNLECTHSINDETDTCDWCGKWVDFSKCVVCDGHMLSEHSAVTDRNVVLGDEIKLNAYLAIEEKLAKTEGAKLVIDSTADGGSKSEEYLISELTPETEGALAGKYKITLSLRSIDLLRKVKISVVAEGETCVAYETTVDEYLTALADISESVWERNLIKALRNYGAYAQSYFAGKNGNSDDLADVLPNESLRAFEKTAPEEVTADELLPYAIAVEGGGVTGLGASLTLSSKTMMKLYFAGDESATVAVDGKTVGKTATETSGEYYVTITALTPDAMDDVHTVEITTDEGTTTVSVSVFSALYAIMTDTTAKDSYKSLAKATYLYAEAAKAYKDYLAGSKPERNWDDDGVLKILCLGNSFSIDAVTHLANVAGDLGIDIEIGNFYIGGCYINKHLDVINGVKTNETYTYQHYDNTEKTTLSNCDGDFVMETIADNDWDFVTLQQASIYSDVPDEYARLTELIKIVEDCNSEAKIVWHMTWAYENEYAVEKGKVSQHDMYNGIVSTVQSCVLPYIDTVIPTGTSVQNARTSSLVTEYDYTRDGTHLDNGIGRYIASIAYFATLTGIDVSGLEWTPDGVDATARAIAIESVKNAIAKPFEITNSTYTEVAE